jgi:hypothetical protein
MRPKKLKLGLHTFPVSYHRGPVDEAGELCGQIRYTGERGISISLDESQDMVETLLHEVLHGIMNDRALSNLFHSDTSEEMFVESMGKGLLAAIRENKGLAAFFETGE